MMKEQLRRLSEFNQGLSNQESPSLKFQWHRLLLEQQSEPAKLGIDSNQSSYDSTRYGFSSTRVSTERDYYQSNRYLDILSNTERARSYSLNPRDIGISSITERARSYSLNPKDDIGVSNSAANLDYRFTLPPRNLNVAREWYKGEGDYKRGSSGVKAIEHTGIENLGISKEDSSGDSFREGLFVPLDEYRLSTEKSELITTSLHGDVYDRESRVKSPDLRLDDRREYTHAYLTPTERKFEDYMGTVCEEYGHGDLLSTGIVDPIVERNDEFAHREHLRESSREQHGEVLGYGIEGHEYEEGEVYEDHGSLLSRESGLVNEEDSKMLVMGEYENDQCLDGHNSLRERCSNEPYGTMLKPKRGIEKKSTKHRFVSKKVSSTHSSGGRDIRQRLGSGPKKVNVPPHWSSYNQSNKLGRKIQDDCHGGVWREPSGGNAALAEAEPPENSEDFKQMVNSAFLRYFKQLNVNSAQRRSIMEHRKAGKCSICGSNSKEFVDFKSLAMHAFSSPKFGLRSQHLGFHKALCVFMGWKSGCGMATNKSWVCEILSDAEALALKEDLIIWPPVVIIHNNSIQNKNPDARVIVSIDELHAILKDMGLGEKATICRGKPANQSIMVAKFNSTFSGLQEAERLHKFYAETKRGRAELQPMRSSNSSGRNVETRNEFASKAESVLFGYLGLAEDLDKLDFETKKRCFVKSKKEIQDIANAPLKTE
ncbi:hypothetical protein LguiA_021291 [Lonicera macranthoides]